MKRLTSAQILATAAGRSSRAPLTLGTILRARNDFNQPLWRGQSRKNKDEGLFSYGQDAVWSTSWKLWKLGPLCGLYVMTACINFIVNLVKVFSCATSGHQSNLMEHIYLCDDRILTLVLENSANWPTVHQQTWDTFSKKAFLLLLWSFDHHPHPSGWKLHSRFDSIEGCSLMSWQRFSV